jgi:hypothetical protein
MRKLFAILSVVVLMSMIVPAAFAEPAEVEQTIVAYGGEWLLGEVVEDVMVAFDPVTGAILPAGAPVDVWLYRPETFFGYDPVFDAEWDPADYIAPAFESELRRQSWPTYSEVQAFGFYYFRFMLPRDVAWYPCGFPCQWQCNYYEPFLDEWEFHSPKVLWFSYPDAYTMNRFPLFWPWDLDWFDDPLGFINPYGPPPFYTWYDYPLGQAATPFDTVHPVHLWITDGEGYAMYIWELEILGYRWRTSDLRVDDYYLDWPYLCGGPYDFPDYGNLGSPWAIP